MGSRAGRPDHGRGGPDSGRIAVSGRWRWRPQAKADATAIWKWIAADSPRAASALLDRFEAVSLTLAENPELGPRREELAPGLRSFPVSAYMLFYRPAPFGIEIVRILHSRQDNAADLF